MRKSMYIDGFSDYIKSKNPNKILFSSDDQQRGIIPCSMMFYCLFSSIKVDMKMNTVILTNEHGMMTIKFISIINIDEERSLLGTVVTIYCTSHNPSQYTLCLCE